MDMAPQSTDDFDRQSHGIIDILGCRPQLFDAAVIQSISNLDASHGMIERC
jgi:hypothetical protein